VKVSLLNYRTILTSTWPAHEEQSHCSRSGESQLEGAAVLISDTTTPPGRKMMGIIHKIHREDKNWTEDGRLHGHLCELIVGLVLFYAQRCKRAHGKRSPGPSEEGHIDWIKEALDATACVLSPLISGRKSPGISLLTVIVLSWFQHIHVYYCLSCTAEFTPSFLWKCLSVELTIESPSACRKSWNRLETPRIVWPGYPMGHPLPLPGAK
jgi:hypothetical protein